MKIMVPVRTVAMALVSFAVSACGLFGSSSGSGSGGSGGSSSKSSSSSTSSSGGSGGGGSSSTSSSGGSGGGSSSTASSSSSSGSGGVATTLPINCSQSSQSFNPPCLPENPGATGTGPNLGAVGASGFGHATIDGCVIDSANHRVIATVNGSSDMNVGGMYNVIVAFDLTTGNRTILSGNWTDPKTGDFTTGNGPAFGGVGGIQPAPGGGYYVLNVTTAGSQLFQVSPSGDRSVVWTDSDALGSSGSCPIPMNDTAFNPSLDPTFTVGSDGTVYVTPSNSFAVWTLQSGKCSVLTLDDSVDPSINRGKGPNPPAAIGNLLMTPAGALFANGGSGLYQVDTTSGNWTLVSSAKAGVGGGANQGIGGVMTLSKGLIWTGGGTESVDPTSGNRTGYPRPSNIEAGPPIEGVACLQPFPNESYFVVNSNLGGDFDALLLFEPSSGLSMVLSY